MKRFCLLALLLAAACSREELTESPAAARLSHGMIELGEKLDDPYTVENVRSAVRSLYPSKADRVDIHPTDLYVRFLPVSESQLHHLEGLGLYLMDHPMDYRIAKEGDWYHDPLLDDEAITWQYAVVPKDFNFPEEIVYEVLDHCYISEHDPDTRSGDGIDWEAVERESFRLTGNACLGAAVTRGGAESAAPSGRITFQDPGFSGGKPVGVAGVMVACNVFVKIAYAYTDRDGYYSMDVKFASEPRYRLVFKNQAGFSIGFNLVLVPASVSTLGSASPEGIDYNVTEEDDAMLLGRTAVNAAAYDYRYRCDALGINPPPGDIRIWIIPFLPNSSTPMLHHGTVLDIDLIKQYVGAYAPAVAMFLPDITVGARDSASFADYYSSTVHELAHASHYTKMGNTLWNAYVAYIVKSFVTEGGTPYGSGPGTGITLGLPAELFEKGAGMCEVGEMWAYFLGASLDKDRYGGSMPSFPSWLWFRPEILSWIYERGTTREEIFRALGEESADAAGLRRRLTELYPERDGLFEEAFKYYGK